MYNIENDLILRGYTKILTPMNKKAYHKNINGLDVYVTIYIYGVITMETELETVLRIINITGMTLEEAENKFLV